MATAKRPSVPVTSGASRSGGPYEIGQLGPQGLYLLHAQLDHVALFYPLEKGHRVPTAGRVAVLIEEQILGEVVDHGHSSLADDPASRVLQGSPS